MRATWKMFSLIDLEDVFSDFVSKCELHQRYELLTRYCVIPSLSPRTGPMHGNQKWECTYSAHSNNVQQHIIIQCNWNVGVQAASATLEYI